MSLPRLALPDTGAGHDLERAVRARLARLDAIGFADRLRRHDVALWGEDPARREVAAHRLGWLEVASLMRPQTAALRDFASGVTSAGFTHAILLGMGGSSLAPETLARAFPARAGGLGLAVLDNTSPAAVEAALDSHDPRSTLFVVSSKSGSTVEVSSFERCAFEWMRAARGDRAGDAFVAVTDPGTALERLARERGYRRVFTNPEDIGGRYSALSFFGLVPAALMGLDLDALLDSALAESAACGPHVAADAHPGLLLGAALAELALAGRDKVTLVLPPPLESLGAWVEQLLAESTGKDGRGLIPVDGETLAPPAAYGDDRVFVSVTVGDPGPEMARGLESLRAAGHPVFSWSRASVADLGAEFLRWEIATAVAGEALGVNPFDEPNVAEAKLATRALLDRFVAAGAFDAPTPVAAAGGLSASAPPEVAARLRERVADARDPLAWATALPALLSHGDYFALLAFVHSKPSRDAALQMIRSAVRRSTRAATTLGYGPRYLHSTGQLHKGGPDRGVFLQIVAAEGDRAIPGEPHGFLALQQAQAMGEYRVLEHHGRRVLRLDLGHAPDAGLDRLAAAFASAAGL